MPVKIADIETQKKAGTRIANALKLLLKKRKEQKEKEKANRKTGKKGRGKILSN